MSLIEQLVATGLHIICLWEILRWLCELYIILMKICQNTGYFESILFILQGDIELLLLKNPLYYVEAEYTRAMLNVYTITNLKENLTMSPFISNRAWIWTKNRPIDQSNNRLIFINVVDMEQNWISRESSTMKIFLVNNWIKFYFWMKN